jgi:diguanylate cyclase (GGDEF)-like protein
MSNDSSAKYAENAAILGADAEGKPLRSAVCCPLMLAESVMGAILVECFRQDAYTERNFETARALASYIAIALNNARQSDELKAKAAELEQASRTDALTGLYNRRHAMEKLEEERVRFQRSARPFSIVICDIDFFKKVNDAHGHDCGDAVLKTLAGLLRRHIRGQDCLARWGGEEFLLLLPETGKEGAAVLAEKLRKRVEEHEFTYAGSKIPVTMTFGVAEYAGDYDIDAAIVGADGALYKGKNGGRNRVVVF